MCYILGENYCLDPMSHSVVEMLNLIFSTKIPLIFNQLIVIIFKSFSNLSTQIKFRDVNFSHLSNVKFHTISTSPTNTIFKIIVKSFFCNIDLISHYKDSYKTNSLYRLLHKRIKLGVCCVMSEIVPIHFHIMSINGFLL